MIHIFNGGVSCTTLICFSYVLSAETKICLLQNANAPTNRPPKYDVKGRAKGQGQSAEVTRNRNYKTAHKARGANHNRKAGARSKMSKGMF